jgi:hypothetical protein
MTASGTPLAETMRPFMSAMRHCRLVLTIGRFCYCRWDHRGNHQRRHWGGDSLGRNRVVQKGLTRLPIEAARPIATIRSANGPRLLRVFRDTEKIMPDIGIDDSEMSGYRIPCEYSSRGRDVAWIGLTISGTKRHSIGAFLKKPKTLSSSKSFSSWQRFVRR